MTCYRGADGPPSFSGFFFSSRRRHTRCSRDWSSDVCSSDLDPAHARRDTEEDLRVEDRLLGRQNIRLALRPDAARDESRDSLDRRRKTRPAVTRRLRPPPACPVPGSAASCTATLSINREDHMQKIVPFLWFDGTAEEAMNFYVSIFKNSKVVRVSRYGEAGPGPKGTVMSATFQLEGQDFYALNGGPQFKFTPAISLFVNCETQQEVDELWKKLSAGGREDQCGWLQDKYGLSWQVIPTALGRMLGDKDPEKANRVMRAMLQMKKIDIKGLQQAYDRG